MHAVLSWHLSEYTGIFKVYYLWQFVQENPMKYTAVGPQQKLMQSQSEDLMCLWHRQQVKIELCLFVCFFFLTTEYWHYTNGILPTWSVPECTTSLDLGDQTQMSRGPLAPLSFHSHCILQQFKLVQLMNEQSNWKEKSSRAKLNLYWNLVVSWTLWPRGLFLNTWS